MHRKYQKNVGAPTTLTDIEERHLVDVLIAAAKFGSPLTSLDLKMLVKRYLQSLGKQCLSFRDNLPGHDWVLNFLQRHKNLLSKRRSRAEKSEDEIEAYFENLRRSIENISASNIVNFDETNLLDDLGSQTFLFRRGIKYPEHVMNTSKTSISVMFAISGSVLPPYTVYKAERLYDQWTIGGPKNSRYNRSKSGWFDLFTFQD